MPNKIQIKRSTATRQPTADFGELAYTTNGNILWVGQQAGDTSNVIAIGGGRFPGVSTANQATVTDGNNWIDQVATGKLIMGTSGVNTQNITSISYFANSTQLGASAGGSNNEVVPSWSIKTYVDGKIAAVSGSPGGANTQVQFNDSGVFSGTAGFVFNKTTNNLFIANNLSISRMDGNGGTLQLYSNATVVAVNITGNSTVTNTAIQGTTLTISTTNTAMTGVFNHSSGTHTVQGNVTLSGTNTHITSTNTSVTGAFTHSGGVHTVQSNSTFSGTNTHITSTNTSVTGAFNVGGISNFTGNANFSANVVISGDLIVNGSVATINVDTISVEDSIIRLASNNLTTNTIDFGLYGVYGNSTVTSFSGVYRDTSNAGVWTFFSSASEPTTTVDTSAGTYARGSVLANFVTEVFSANSTKVAITAGSLNADLEVQDGGTGAGTFTSKGIIYGNGTGALQVTAAGTTDQLLAANSTGFPVWVSSLDGGTF